MATRFYLTRGATASVSPTPDAEWDSTTGFVRRIADTSEGEVSGTRGQQSVTTTSNSPAGAADVLLGQFISAPLNSDQTISGNFKGQISSAESNAAADMRAQIVMWVYTGSGSRGTLYAGDTGAAGQEFSVFGTFGNRKFPRAGSTALTSVNALAGDRIVIEVGARKHENATTSRNLTMIIGAEEGADDYGEDETDTSQSKTSWVEFDQNITFTSSTIRATQVDRRVAIATDGAVIRATQVTRRVVVLGAAASDMVVQVMWHD